MRFFQVLAEIKFFDALANLMNKNMMGVGGVTDLLPSSPKENSLLNGNSMICARYFDWID